jgi:hypothetical protein
LADPEVIADGLNPLTISHTARTTSFSIIGRYKIIEPEIRPVISNKLTSINNIAAIKPHADNHLGISFD